MRGAAAWISSFALLFLLWLLVVGTVAQAELVAGLAAAAVGASALAIARAVGLLPFRIERRWLAELRRPLLRVVPEFFALVRALLAGRRGAFRTLEFPTGGARRVDAGRRAFAAYAGSLSPARVVVDVDAEDGTVLVHELGGDGSNELP